MNARSMLLLAFALLGGACTPGRLDAIGVSPSTMTAGLIAHYTFDEDGGTVVFDHSGNQRDGVLVGGTWLTTGGRFGGALRFDGGSYVTVGDFPDAPASFTASVWVRINGFAPDAGLETVTSTEYVFDAGWELNVAGPSDSGAYFQAAFFDRIASAYTYSNCTCLPVGVWTHFAFVIDGGAHTMSTYVNGTLASVVPAPEPIAPGAPALSIGRWSMSGRMLVGDVDDLNVYGRALAPEEIEWLDQQPPPDVQ